MLANEVKGYTMDHHADSPHRHDGDALIYPWDDAPPDALDTLDDEHLAVRLHEADISGVDKYPSWVAYARDILRVARGQQ
jgi:hypothetical protein